MCAVLAWSMITFSVKGRRFSAEWQVPALNTFNIFDWYYLDVVWVLPWVYYTDSHPPHSHLLISPLPHSYHHHFHHNFLVKESEWKLVYIVVTNCTWRTQTAITNKRITLLLLLSCRPGGVVLKSGMIDTVHFLKWSHSLIACVDATISSQFCICFWRYCNCGDSHNYNRVGAYFNTQEYQIIKITVRWQY